MQSARNSNESGTKNSWLIKRETDGLTVVVMADYIRRQSIWSVRCEVNGELVEACLSDDPHTDALSLIGDAYMLLDGEESGSFTFTVNEPEPEPA